MSRYALVVGIGQYQRLKSLSKPAGDAQAVCDLLRDRGNFNEIHPLLNAEATYDALVEKLEYVLLKQGDRAEVLLYFTGHGFTAGQSKRAQQGYLATSDCKVTLDADGNVTYAERALSFQELNALIAEAKPAKLAMLLDCCHSEFFVEQSLIGRGLSGFGDRGYFLSAACRSYEKAWANPHENHSVYTGALLQALRAERSQDITASEAHNSIQRQLKGSGQEPIPFGYGDSLALVTYLREVATGVSEECPYQSLNAFTPETAEFFFGREAEVNELREKLRRANFVPVLGPSGSGKSSVVRAGLVTRLQTEGWQAVAMKPDKQPMVELERVLRQFFEGVRFSTGKVREVLGGLGFGEAFPQALGALEQADIKLLLIVDQFEEVFTLCEDKAAQQAFIRRLFYLGEIGAARIKVVMTMRSDFVDNWLAAELSRSVIGEDTVWLGALQGENLRAVIERPAQKQGYAFEAGLLKLLLTDVAQEENCLPLLEFALTGLWDRRETQTKKLTVSAYEAMGGLTGALNRQATDVYENLREVDRPWEKRICLQLVRVGRGDKDTRQRQPKAVLLNMGGRGAAVGDCGCDCGFGEGAIVSK